ncbi:hypothetical protein J6590_026759 [Homalodisca vitripennis]|nr:hypothetical protein J6590_026759 [Homalodisca vitripennis]
MKRKLMMTEEHVISAATTVTLSRVSAILHPYNRSVRARPVCSRAVRVAFYRNSVERAVSATSVRARVKVSGDVNRTHHHINYTFIDGRECNSSGTWLTSQFHYLGRWSTSVRRDSAF